MIFYINYYMSGLPCNIFSFFLALILFRRELETAAEIIVNNLGIKKKNNIDKHKKESYQMVTQIYVRTFIWKSAV